LETLGEQAGRRKVLGVHGHGPREWHQSLQAWNQSQLDDDGICYAAGKPGCYLPANFDQELSKLEVLLKGLSATLETSYDEGFMTQKREALRQQGVSLLTIQVEPDEMTIH